MRLTITKLLLLELLSGLMIVLAFIVEYGYGYAPCYLCIIQRSFWLLIILLIPTFLIFFPANKQNKVDSKLIFWLLLVLIFANISVASYHVLLELKIITLAPECSNLLPLFKSKDSFDILAPYIPCDRPPFTVFNISPAGFNLIFNVFALWLIFTKFFTQSTKS